MKKLVVALVVIAWICIQIGVAENDFFIVSSDINNLSVAIPDIEKGGYSYIPVTIMGDITLKETIAFFKVIEINSSSNLKNSSSEQWMGLRGYYQKNEVIVLIKGNSHYFLYRQLLSNQADLSYNESYNRIAVVDVEEVNKYLLAEGIFYFQKIIKQKINNKSAILKAGTTEIKKSKGRR